MPSTTVHARDFVRDNRSVVESAEELTAEVLRLLDAGGSVVVSVRGVRGISSSFFNVLLKAVSTATPDIFMSGRFCVETDTDTQRTVYERSLKALLGQMNSNLVERDESAATSG